MNAIEIKKLTKKYKDVTAVDGLELSVRQGELFALLGVNGAGKTTTIKMLSCLTAPTSGEAHLGGAFRRLRSRAGGQAAACLFSAGDGGRAESDG